jgi:glutamine phosphoribosylpyrophosphate amidotransferase
MKSKARILSLRHGDDMLIGVRDPFGIRPLVLGKLGEVPIS